MFGRERIEYTTPEQIAVMRRAGLVVADIHAALRAAVELTASTDEVVARLTRRAELEGRSDDTEDVVRRRLEVYAEQTAPLTQVYAERGLLRRVDGLGDVEEVTDRLMAALDGA